MLVLCLPLDRIGMNIHFRQFEELILFWGFHSGRIGLVLDILGVYRTHQVPVKRIGSDLVGVQSLLLEVSLVYFAKENSMNSHKNT